MRALLLAAFALASMPISACGQASNDTERESDLAIAGLPATDHTWTTQEFEAAAAALASLPTGRLPHSTDSGAEALFQRLTEPAVMAPCADAETAVNTRINECLRLLNSSGRVLRLYATAQQSDLSYSDDAMRVMGSMLRATVAMLKVADEFKATLDTSDPTYTTRMQGFERMRLGATQIVQGSLLMLTTERRLYSDTSAAAFASILAETYPTLSRNFPSDTKARFDQTLASIARGDPSADVRAALSTYAASPHSSRRLRVSDH